MRQRSARGGISGIWAVICAGAVLLMVSVSGGERIPAAAHGSRTGEHLVYASPIEMLFSRDGARLYVLCQEADEVRVLDSMTFAELRGIPVGHIPRGFALSHDGTRLFVANSWDDTLSVIDTRTLRVTAGHRDRCNPRGGCRSHPASRRRAWISCGVFARRAFGRGGSAAPEKPGSTCASRTWRRVR
ncbi:hypothetical protein DYQ86_23910 [Acidobacteria bacterium AB60]|nr:hypothetical protein DYQ86_23910 [Acidobacteria bacterium AB60]